MTSEIIRAAIRQSTGKDGKVAVTHLVVNLSGVQQGSIYKVCLAFDKFRGISAATRRGVTRNVEPEDAVVYASISADNCEATSHLDFYALPQNG